MTVSGVEIVNFAFLAQEQGGLNLLPWVIGFIILVLLLAWALSRSKNKFPEVVAKEEGPQKEESIPLTGAEYPEQTAIAPPDTVINEGHVKDPEVVNSPQIDDLTIIEGIGPAMQEILNEAGITTYQKLAAADPVILKNLLMDVGLRFVDPSDWPEQARLAAQGRMDRLDEYKKRMHNL